MAFALGAGAESVTKNVHEILLSILALPSPAASPQRYLESNTEFQTIYRPSIGIYRGKAQAERKKKTLS